MEMMSKTKTKRWKTDWRGNKEGFDGDANIHKLF